MLALKIEGYSESGDLKKLDFFVDELSTKETHVYERVPGAHQRYSAPAQQVEPSIESSVTKQIRPH